VRRRFPQGRDKGIPPPCLYIHCAILPFMTKAVWLTMPAAAVGCVGTCEAAKLIAHVPALFMA
jgi:hypothetical protein